MQKIPRKKEIIEVTIENEDCLPIEYIDYEISDEDSIYEISDNDYETDTDIGELDDWGKYRNNKVGRLHRR